MVMKFTNNATTTLASNITSSATSLTVSASTGSLFPTLGGSDYFYCTLANTNGAIEIVKVTARSTDTFTITRGQDGTSGQAWNSGDKVELRLVAASLNDIPKLDEANTFSGANAYGTPASITLTNATGLSLTAGVTGTLPVANGGTGVTTSTGSGANVLGTAPTIASANLTTALTLTGASGTAGQVLTSGGSGGAPTWSSPSTTSISNGTSNVTVNSSGGTITAATNGTTAITVDTSQNVGIGTASPAYKVDITGVERITGNADQQYNFRVQYGSTGFGLYQDDTNGYTRISAYDTTGTTYGKGLTFATAPAGSATTERMRIDSNGNLLIGMTTPSTANAGILNYSQAQLGAAYGRTDYSKTYSGNVTGNGYYYNNTSVGSITYSNTAVAFNTSSDYRLKENIEPMVGALAKVAALKPVTYKWKADGSDGQGFIAHELAEVCPDAVTGEKDAVDAEGKPVYQGIDTSFLVATLTAALQETKALIDTQAALISGQATEIAELKAKVG